MACPLAPAAVATLRQRSRRQLCLLPALLIVLHASASLELLRGRAATPDCWAGPRPGRRPLSGSAAAAWELSGRRDRLRSAGTAAEASGGAAVAGGGADAGDSELPRRVLLGGAGAALLLGAVKRFGVDGGMDEFDVAPGSLAGKTVVITGGNTGLGRESAIRLAKGGARVIFTARTEEKGQEALEAIRKASGSSEVYFEKLDLADLASVRAFSERYEQQPYGDRIDVLMNNAGVMAIPERAETKDGFERQFGVNHLGHFALVGLLLPLLRKAKGFARIVNVSSTAHLGATKELMEGDLMAPERYTQWGAYCQSKLANVLFAKELDRRFKAEGVQATAVSCHPGGVDTDLARFLVSGKDDPNKAKELRRSNAAYDAISNFLTRTVKLGANTQIYLAAGADGGLDKSGGEYFDNMSPGLLNPAANDEALAKQLWTESERLTGVKISL